MLSKSLTHLRRQWLGALALFLVLTGGIAYAANTVGTEDVIDNSLLSADLKNNQGVKTADVTNASLAGIDVASNTLTGANIDESSLGQVPSADLLDGVDSTGFVRGNGRVFSHFGLTLGGGTTTVLDVAGYAKLTLHCSEDGDSATIGVTNHQSEFSFIHVYADTGNANPDFSVATAAAGEVTVATLGGGGVEKDMATLLFGGETDTPGRVMTVTIGTSTTGAGSCISSTHASLVG